MVDIGKPMGKESHMICVPNYTHNFDFIPCIWNWSHDKD